VSALCRKKGWRAVNNTALDRITIRLRPGDRLAIRHRAAERRMKDSAHIAALVRGHLAGDPGTRSVQAGRVGLG